MGFRFIITSSHQFVSFLVVRLEGARGASGERGQATAAVLAAMYAIGCAKQKETLISRITSSELCKFVQ